MASSSSSRRPTKMPRKDPNTGQISAQAQQDLLSESIDNFELPKSLVHKIAKSNISVTSRLQKEVVLSITKSSTVFINYIAATAHDVALSKQHKSISASDVLKALEVVGFGELVDQLQTELQAYRDISKHDKGKKASSSVSTPKSPSKGKGKAAAPSTPSAPPAVAAGNAVPEQGNVEVEEEEEEEGDEPEAEADDVDPAAEQAWEAEMEDPMALEEQELRGDAPRMEESEQVEGSSIL